MSFIISALPASTFQHLIGATRAELSAHSAVRMKVNVSPGFPCRVSLEDAEPGEDVILVNYEHLPTESPYRSSHAIFIREQATEAQLAAGDIPVSLRIRLLSLRAFDDDGMMVNADVVHGRELESAIERMLENSSAAYLHVHNAKPGCYAARVDRA